MKLFELKTNSKVYFTTIQDIRDKKCDPMLVSDFKIVEAKGRILDRENIYDFVCYQNGRDKTRESSYPWIKHYVKNHDMTIMFITENGKNFIGMTHNSNVVMLG